MLRSTLGAVLIVGAIVAPAHADGAAADDALAAFDDDGRLSEAELAIGNPHRQMRTMSQQLADGMTALGAEIDTHLQALSLELVGLRVDGRKRAARLRLGRVHDGAGASLDSNVTFKRGKARVAAHFDLEIGGDRYSLDLPEFELVPRSEAGERYLEVRIPIFEGTF